MNLSSLIKVFRRHARVVVPVGIAGLLLCLLLVVVKGPTYRASASAVLINPPALPETTPDNPTIPQEYQNPYARFQDLSVIVDILVKVLGNDEVASSMKADGLVGDIQIAANRDFYRGPIVEVAAEADNPEQAKRSAQIVLDELDSQLTALQEAQGTDPSYYITMTVIQPPTKATRVLSGTLRLLIVALGMSAVITVGAGLFADAHERRRRAVADEWDESDADVTGDYSEDDIERGPERYDELDDEGRRDTEAHGADEDEYDEDEYEYYDDEREER